MQLPGGVPYGLVGKLSRVYLQRPLVQRIELIVVTYLTERREPSPNLPIFHQARAPQIKEAMEQVAAYTGNRLSPRRTGDLMLLVDYLADYPDVYHGNIVGLAGRTIRWHRELTALYMAQLREFGAHEFFARWRSLRNATLPPHTLTAQPPLPLPETPGVTFLDTVGAICEEGTDMRHCIASYARGAVDGRHHLFHVTYEGEHATVMVDAYSGRVLQAHGPRNQRNNAVAWGTRVLNQWGRQWPQGSNYDHERGDMG
jgi:hypothetical protein